MPKAFFHHKDTKNTEKTQRTKKMLTSLAWGRGIEGEGKKHIIYHVASPILMIFFHLIFSIFPLSAQDTITDTASGVSYRVEKFINANFPVGMAFAPDGRLFYNEKTTGNVRVVSADGHLQAEPVIHLPTDALQERGLLGIALDPDHENNGFIWVYHTAEGNTRDYPTNKVLRFHEENGIGSDPQVMLAVPIETGNLLHNGGNLHFDADGFLYVSIGDYGDSTFTQNLDIPAGKIHRFVVDGDSLSIPDDNPFAGSSIFANGLRNPFDFAFDTLSGRLFATENGLNCDDEVNLILAGFNYGWSDTYECIGTEGRPSGIRRYLPPLLSFTPTIAPTGIIFYANPAAPQWENDLFFCAWNDGILRRVSLSDGRNAVEAVHEMDLGDTVTCKLDIVMSADGALYFGTVDDTGGAIYRLIPT